MKLIAQLIGTSVAAVLVTVGGAAASAAPAPAPFSAGPTPSFTVNSYALTVRTRGSSVRHISGAFQRFSTTPSDPADTDIASRDKLLLTGATRQAKGVRTRNPYIAQPDGVTGPDDQGLRLARYVVTLARSNRLNLIATRLAGRDTLKAEVDVPANDCLELPEGTATIWLTKSTLLPKRLDIERDGVTRTFNYTFAAFNQSVPNRSLRAPALGRSPLQVDQRFKRRSPQAARGPLPFTPRLPTRVPTGFTLVQSGWAPQGARTGPGGFNRRDSWLFQAVYRRGWERIEITQRIATHGTWRADPFQKTCQSLRGGRARISGVGAKYGVGPDVTSHLWWRAGNQLFTVSGPYGKGDLSAIANSLTRIP